MQEPSELDVFERPSDGVLHYGPNVPRFDIYDLHFVISERQRLRSLIRDGAAANAMALQQSGQT